MIIFSLSILELGSCKVSSDFGPVLSDESCVVSTFADWIDAAVSDSLRLDDTAKLVSGSMWSDESSCKMCTDAVSILRPEDDFSSDSGPITEESSEIGASLQLVVSAISGSFKLDESSCCEISVDAVSVHISEDDFCKDSSDFVNPISTTLLMFPFLSDSVG